MPGGQAGWKAKHATNGTRVLYYAENRHLANGSVSSHLCPPSFSLDSLSLADNALPALEILLASEAQKRLRGWSRASTEVCKHSVLTSPAGNKTLQFRSPVYEQAQRASSCFTRALQRGKRRQKWGVVEEESVLDFGNLPTHPGGLNYRIFLHFETGSQYVAQAGLKFKFLPWFLTLVLHSSRSPDRVSWQLPINPLTQQGPTKPRGDSFARI